MTDTPHEAPERIWAGNEGFANSWDWEDPVPGWTEYVRADLVQAAVAAALTEAAEHHMRHARGYAKIGEERDKAIHETHAQAILALITPDAQAALDRVVAAEREQGFWLGRKCGGSKAEIDAALATIREGGE